MPTPIFELIEEEDAGEEVRQTYRDIKARYAGACPTSTRRSRTIPSTWRRSTST
jgi:hypothetical protein